MLPQPTLPKRPAPAMPPREVMTPLFALPGGEPDPGRSPRHRAARPPGRGRRGTARLPAARADRDVPLPARRAGRAVRGEPGPDHADLLAVTAPRLRRALARSFLRYGVPGDPERAVHAAMNVVEPVLEARDSEILRLRDLIAASSPRRVVSPAGA
jgi:hypothetical protein